MKIKPIFFAIFFTFILIVCKPNQPKNSTQLNSTSSSNNIKIDEAQLLNNIKILASDSLEGRGFSKPGN